MKLIGRTLPGSLFGGPVGLANLIQTKGWPGGEIRKAHAQMRAALDAIAAFGATRIETVDLHRVDNPSAIKDKLYDYTVVLEHLGVPLLG